MSARRGQLVLVAGACLGLCACGGGGARHTGVRIGDETLRQFEAGVTTEGWLLAILGPPTARTPVAGVENTEVFRYSLDERSAGLASLVSGGSSRNTAVVYFVLTNGVVTRFWADRETERTITGRPVQDENGEKSSGVLP
jgi:hypothetical protein